MMVTMTRILHQALSIRMHSNLTREIQVSTTTQWRIRLPPKKKKEQVRLPEGPHLCQMYRHLVMFLRYRHLARRQSNQENLAICLERRLLLFLHPKKHRKRRTRMSMTHTNRLRQHMTSLRLPSSHPRRL
jgi:hypothetical protein